MAQLYKPDGTIEPFPEPANGSNYTLQEVRDAIGGGYVQVCRTKNGHKMLVDEDGKPKGFPLNTAATEIYIYGDQDPIVGDALVIEANQFR